MSSTNTAEKVEQTKKKSALRENVEAILLAIVLALFIRTFVVQAFKIPSGSMQETLLIGDHILVNKFIYGVKLPFVMTTIIPYKEPHRGDIVVFNNGLLMNTGGWVYQSHIISRFYRFSRPNKRPGFSAGIRFGCFYSVPA